MKINDKAVHHDLKHADNLKLKISKTADIDLISEDDKLSNLEHKKHIADAIHRTEHHNSRSKEKHDAIKYELENADVVV